MHTTTEFLIAGFGGQGVLLTGQVLAYAALEAGRHVTWIPSYGPEMRGGTANCTVVISTEPIGAPLVRNPTVVIALNQPSFDKYEPIVRVGGVLAVNASLTNRPPARTDVRVIAPHATEMAERAGSAKVAGIVLLGAAVAATGVLELGDIELALDKHLPARHRDLLPVNISALWAGAELVAEPEI